MRSGILNKIINAIYLVSLSNQSEWLEIENAVALAAEIWISNIGTKEILVASIIQTSASAAAEL